MDKDHRSHGTGAWAPGDFRALGADCVFEAGVLVFHPENISLGRNVYVDSLDSDLGHGWKRVNSFLAHGPNGGFCYGFFEHGGGTGVGRELRATVIGPGVTPDVGWQGAPPARYDVAEDRAADADLSNLLHGDSLCRAN